MSETIDVEMEVAVRKYKVDKERLVKVLKEHKGTRTNKEIAEILGKPVTLVEHWFRNDSGFAVPEPDIWFELKDLLGIKTTEFDQSITEFEFKESNFDSRNRIYASDISPTLTCGCGNHLHLINENESQISDELDQPTKAYAMTTGSFMQIRKEAAPTLAARDYKDPPLVCFEESAQGFGQTSYSSYVQGMGSTLCSSGGSYGGGSESLVVENKPDYIVRRLTPVECARLQGFADSWGVPDYKESLTDEEYDFWLDVRNTYASVNGKREKEYTKPQMLTWYNKLHSDSAEYKMWGNGVALPPTLYVMQGIYDVLSEEGG